MILVSKMQAFKDLNISMTFTAKIMFYPVSIDLLPDRKEYESNDIFINFAESSSLH